MQMDMKSVFRDAKSFYLNNGGASPVNAGIIDFCRSRAGLKILDYGCATGSYCIALRQLGFECVGVDVNQAYVTRAIARGVEARVVGETLPFSDASFDTVLLIDVLEHVPEPSRLITEALRVARKNLLITVPNAGRFDDLKRAGLTYEHMLERDHVRFFTKETLERLLAGHCKEFSVRETDPRFVHYLLPWYFRKPLTFFAQCGFLAPSFYGKLYAECRIERQRRKKGTMR